MRAGVVAVTEADVDDRLRGRATPAESVAQVKRGAPVSDLPDNGARATDRRKGHQPIPIIGQAVNFAWPNAFRVGGMGTSLFERVKISSNYCASQRPKAESPIMIV